jgi:Gram-negative bacterial TonB protein C-terminal
MCRVLLSMLVVSLSLSWSALGQTPQPPKPPANGGDFSDAINPPTKVPKDVILVKGAWSSASDSVTPVPEGSSLTNGIFSNAYFGISYTLPAGPTKNYDGPPPSDTGRYVLAQIKMGDTSKKSPRGSILITADDMFFTPLPASNALQLVNYMKNNLQADHQQEEPPTPTKIADRPFAFFAYWSPVAQIHWYVAATEIRCHTVEVVLTSRDTKLLENWLLELDKMTLPADAGPTTGTGGGTFPVCVKDYARGGNVLARVDPVFTQPRANPVPVRIIIDKKGNVKHIHFLSAFPEQTKAITDALFQWRFKPYLQNGQPVEVETGIMFGRDPRAATTRSAGAATD